MADKPCFSIGSSSFAYEQDLASLKCSASGLGRCLRWVACCCPTMRVVRSLRIYVNPDETLCCNTSFPMMTEEKNTRESMNVQGQTSLLNTVKNWQRCPVSLEAGENQEQHPALSSALSSPPPPRYPQDQKRQLCLLRITMDKLQCGREGSWMCQVTLATHPSPLQIYTMSQQSLGSNFKHFTEARINFTCV